MKSAKQLTYSANEIQALIPVVRYYFRGVFKNNNVQNMKVYRNNG